MFAQLTTQEIKALRGKMARAAQDTLEEARALEGFPDAKEAYGVDASDFLSLLAEVTMISLDTYPAVAA